MADEKETSSIQDEAQAVKEQVVSATSGAALNLTTEMIAEYMEYFWQIWADFQLVIIDPIIDQMTPPHIIEPAINPDTNEKEHVFNIIDEGFRMTTSRGSEAFVHGQSMFKFYMTIEKMVALLVERLKTGGVAKDAEVRVAFYGFELGQRKAFESILNLQENVVVVNYDADVWGERFMKMVLELAERGYGMPSQTPRKSY